jgi:hypothetical protein
MPRPKRELRNGRLWCPGCGRWLHTSRFRPNEKGHGTAARFHSKCRTCEQTERTGTKNDDRARALVESRATTRARKSKVTKQFVMEDLNYESLIAPMRAFMGDDGLCNNCGHAFLGERDIQLEHREPPRHDQDWARLHARNIGFSCGSCNRPKTNKTYVVWLDEEEDARLSAEAWQRSGGAAFVNEVQTPRLFEMSEVWT